MHKAKIALLAVSACFLCVLAGIFIGRQTGSNYMSLPVAASNQSAPAADTRNESVPPATQDPELGKVNINTATLSQLTQLPGIGDSLGQRIIDYRSEHGPFENVDQLKNVSGIGDKKLEAFRQYITTGGE